MDLHKMQYFKDVYELNSFTKAANKNFVYQSAVTQQIASIEKELGVLLFEREHGKITHTQAGNIFYQECRDILDEYEHVLEEIKNHSSHKVQIQKKLKIGFSGVMDNNFIMLINEYMCRYPEVRIDFIEGSYMSLCEKLVSQEIDIIFGVACELENIPGTVWKVLFTENQKILLSRMNELAEKDVLSMDELGSQTLIVPSKDMMPSCHKKGMQLCKKTKYRMNIDFVDSFEAVKMKVASNQGITFVMNSFKTYDYDSFKKVRFCDIHFVCTLGITYLKNNKNRLIDNFSKILD